MSNDGWFPDPAGIHELRYFDGNRWTHHVSNQGIGSMHPWTPVPPPAAAPGSASSYQPTIRPAGSPPAYSAYGGAAGWPAAAPPGGGRRSNKRLGIIAAIVAMIVLVGGGVGVYAAVHEPTERKPRATGESSPSPQATGRPTATAEPPDPSQTEGPGSPGKPQWNSTVRPVSVIGPQFAPREPVYTMAFVDWPFAFRVPSTFGCLRGKVELPSAKGYVCVNESNLGAKQRINIMFRPCPTTCTRSEQQSMTTAWFEAPGQRPTVFDATTSYLEDPSNDRGLYGLDMSHFFGPKPGGPLRWQVGIYIESPTATKATLHKVVNDVRSQTP